MVLGSMSGVLLSTASFYKALGGDEKKMSSLSFRVLALISFLAVIISIPVAIFVVDKFFPEYAEGIKVLVLLLLASTLPYPIMSLTNFIIAVRKSLRPFLVLSVLNGSLVIPTSFLLIPRLGIIGGALSQVIVSVISSLFIVLYSTRAYTFTVGRREITLFVMMPLIGVYEVFVDPPYLDFLLVLLVPLLFKLLKIICIEDVKIIESFLPSKLKFIAVIMRVLSGERSSYA
jgi:O-antigen/teichoic acid export membrane protein